WSPAGVWRQPRNPWPVLTPRRGGVPALLRHGIASQSTDGAGVVFARGASRDLDLHAEPKRGGNELLLMSLKSGLDIISEWFEHEKVRMHFVKLMTENLQTAGREGHWIGRACDGGRCACNRTGIAQRRIRPGSRISSPTTSSRAAVTHRSTWSAIRPPSAAARS